MTEQNTTDETPRCTILKHAVKLFHHYGYNKTNIGDIAKACSMSPGNIYRFFSNKQELGLAAVAIHFAKIEELMRHHAADSNKTASEKLEAAITSCVEFTLNEMQENPKLIEIADIVCNHHDGSSEILKQHIQTEIEIISGIIQNGVNSGQFTSSNIISDAEAIITSIKTCCDPHDIVICGFEKTRETTRRQIAFSLRALKA